MKLHIDLVKDILLALEECEEPNCETMPSTLKYDIETVMYHCILLEEAGYIKLEWMDSIDIDDEEEKVTDTNFLVERLTLKGHNLATLMQTESWSRIAAEIYSSRANIPLNLIEQIVTSLEGKKF